MRILDVVTVTATTRVTPEHTTFFTRDAGEAHEVLNRWYVDHRVRLAPDRKAFALRQSVRRAGTLAVDHLRVSATTEVGAEPMPEFLATMVVGGRVWTKPTGGSLYRWARGDAYIYRSDEPYAIGYQDMEVRLLRLARADLERAAAVRTGLAPADFRLTGEAPVSAAMRRHWWATAAYVHRLFAGPDPDVAEPLLLAAAVDLVAATALAVFPNTATSAAYVAGPGRVAPAAVRRAVAHIDDHAQEPITVADIAAAAGVGPRGLQAAFARHVGMTPTAYLRRVRLERAHRELQAADPARGDTVAAVARRWAFANPGRFAVEYREAFGHSPSRTLRG